MEESVFLIILILSSSVFMYLLDDFIRYYINKKNAKKCGFICSNCMNWDCIAKSCNYNRNNKKFGDDFNG